MKTVHGKVGNMRKTVSWVVYPASRNESNPDELLVQCDKRMLRLNIKTGKGVLSKAQNYPGFHSVTDAAVTLEQATIIDVPQEFIDQCVEGQAKSGDHIGGGVYIA